MPAGYKQKQVLHDLYHKKKMSISDMADELNVHEETVRKYMDEHSIERRSQSEATALAKQKGPAPYITSRSDGYRCWIHTYKNEKHTVWVHRLLAVCEYGIEAVKDKQVHHKNGVKWDNRPDNITLLSQEEHVKHHVDQGDMLPGYPKQKITHKDCDKIREMRSNGQTQIDLAKKYDVNRCTIRKHEKGECNHE